MSESMVSPAPVAPAPRPTRRLRRTLGVVVVLVVAVLAAVIAVVTLRSGEASSPSDLADRFPEAGITCLDYDVIFDGRDSKALGCRGEAGQIITVTTYGTSTSVEEWLALRCRDYTPESIALGAYVVGEDFVVDIMQGAVPAGYTPPAVDAVAADLAGVVGGTPGSYDCSAVG